MILDMILDWLFGGNGYQIKGVLGVKKESKSKNARSVKRTLWKYKGK